MHLSLSAKLGRLPIVFSAPVRDYFARLDAAGLRVGKYDLANARLIDRLVANGGNFWPDSGAFNAMAGYLYPGNGEDLIPLHPNHDAGTLNAFVTGDWNAVTGLKGDGSTKYVDSNRANNADGQNDKSLGAYKSQSATATNRGLIGVWSNSGGASWVFDSNESSNGTARINSTSSVVANYKPTQLAAASRDSSSEILIYAESLLLSAQSSSAPNTENIDVFRAANSEYSNARIPFYHIGPNLSGAGELAELDSILTDWQTDLANA